MARSAASKGLAIVTGASSGIGFELAKCAAQDGYDLVIAADDPEIEKAAEQLKTFGFSVDAILTDLSTIEGIDRLLTWVESADVAVELLMANAGHGLGKGFLDQEFTEARNVVDTNIVGTIYLVQQIGNQMRARGRGRILFTGSIAGFIPGSYQAVYNGTKAFVNSFSFALREELKDTGVTVSCLMPGATETNFFKRAGMTDTSVGAAEKDDPADVARVGYDAMLAGDGDVVAGWKNKLQTTIANITPSSVLAHKHAETAKPGSSKQ